MNDRSHTKFAKKDKIYILETFLRIYLRKKERLNFVSMAFKKVLEVVVLKWNALQKSVSLTGNIHRIV